MFAVSRTEGVRTLLVSQRAYVPGSWYGRVKQMTRPDDVCFWYICCDGSFAHSLWNVSQKGLGLKC